MLRGGLSPCLHFACVIKRKIKKGGVYYYCSRQHTNVTPTSAKPVSGAENKVLAGDNSGRTAHSNDLPAMIRRFGSEGRIHFMHVRNIKFVGERGFNETAHKTECGSLDIYGIMKALHDINFDGYIRPDHGRMIWGETGRPGYGLFDRALGAVYLNGLWEAICKDAQENKN